MSIQCRKDTPCGRAQCEHCNPPTCVNCKYFVEDQQGEIDNRFPIATCRRRAPNPGNWRTRWPNVDPGEWCGEHERKTSE